MTRYLHILFFLALSAPGSGQVLENHDKIFKVPVSQKDYLSRVYFETVPAPNELINGKEYFRYYLHSETTPLLFSGEVINATLKIKNREYQNIGIQYDTYLDELIYTDTTRMINNVYPLIALNKDIIEGFVFVIRGDSMNFRYLQFQQNLANDMKDGFYEIVYDGNSKFIIKHKSDIYHRDALNEYKYSPEAYIMTGESFKKVKNNQTLLRMCGEWSGVMKEFLKKSRIRIRSIDKKQITKVLVYLDTLKKSNAGMK